jgi:hypothetical protein
MSSSVFFNWLRGSGRSHGGHRIPWDDRAAARSSTARPTFYASWARSLLSLLARLAGARRSASVALSLMLATGAGDSAPDQVRQGVGS